MKVKIKKLVPEATTPKYAKSGDAGLDLTAISYSYDTVNGSKIHTYGTGLAVEIPEGYVGLLFPRSSNYKYPFTLANSVGVIDSGYRGEIKVVFRSHTAYLKPEEIEVDKESGTATAKKEIELYKIGDRVAQLLIIKYPEVEFQEVDELSETARGTGGLGSTGK